ncbi:hypothetical protein PVAND_011195 [Polypedilum vanderplanki]|uniref:HTH CENPB-type domain-containing protein n=1 Tax=Polypedilum vanderplanki TaxID=319348 RepID=A0A9J6CJ77_POLVA|nr:hypothetical protein PVAND_011195 [Polypedilum vanderplanki]
MSLDTYIDSQKIKRKHITLTIQEKIDIINLIESGQSRQAIANRYGVGKTTVHDIYKRKEKIIEFATFKNTDLAKRRRLDVNTQQQQHSSLKNEAYNYKEIVEEEALVETFHDGYEYEQEYEIVYEPTLVNTSELIEVEEQPKQDTPKKRKSKTLTLKEKYDVLKLVESGMSVPKICQKYEIGRTTVYDFVKNKEKIFEYVEKSFCNDFIQKRKTFKTSNYPEIENKMLEWCNSINSYTKNEFFEEYKKAFAELKQLNSSYVGSWSWCKRFFERYPETKRKLISLSEDENSAIKMSPTFDQKIIISNSKSLSAIKINSNASPKKRMNCLSISEKLQVISDLNKGERVQEVMQKWSISKSTIYDIIRRQDEFRHLSQVQSNIDRKIMKGPKYPELENALIVWLFSQSSFPHHTLIQEKAQELFNILRLEGNFNPTTVWVKKFIQRHPEISNRFENIPIKCEFEANNYVIEDESIENLNTETLEFIESEFLPMQNDEDDQEERLQNDDDDYIIEELENEKFDSDFHKYDGNEQNEEEEESELQNEEITDEEALRSLKVLIKYSAKKGHADISKLLYEYQNLLEEDM